MWAYPTIQMPEAAFQPVRPALGLNLGMVIVVVNEAAAGALGRRAEELLGLELSSLVNEPDLELFRSLIDLKTEAPGSERAMEADVHTRQGVKRMKLVIQRLSGNDDVHYGIGFVDLTPTEAIIEVPIPEPVKVEEPIAEAVSISAPVIGKSDLGHLARQLLAADEEDEILLLLEDAVLAARPGSHGMVALIHGEGLRRASAWGRDWPEFVPTQSVWALKAGEEHLSGAGGSRLPAIRGIDLARTTASVPLMARGRVLGVLFINDAQTEGLMEFAIEAARTIQNALGRIPLRTA